MNKINEVITEVQENLEVVINESTDIADDFQGGNTGRANQKIIAYIEKFSVLIKSFEVLNQNQEVAVADSEAGKLRDVLLEMEKAMCSRDYVLLADLLEYEVKEVLMDIRGKLAERC